MMPRVLMIIDSDPRQSPRPAEAIRIAAGISAWQTLELAVYLHGPATALLGMAAEEMPDGENYLHYLPLLGEAGRRLYVQSEATLPDELAESAPAYQSIDPAALAQLTATSTYVLRF